MRVLLVQPPSRFGVGLSAYILPEPLCLESVASVLVPRHEVQVLDMRLEPELRRRLAAFRPDAVGLTASFTADYYNVLRTVQMVKEQQPGCFTFVGGHHATMCPESLSGHVDALVLGEGETTVAELISAREDGQPLSTVPGIIYQADGKSVATGARPLSTDLDGMPLPARHLVSRYADRYHHVARRPYALVETARGCPYRCNFCSVWKFYQGKYRSRSPQRVLAELQNVQAEHILFTDDNFFGDAKRAAAICDGILALGIKKHFMMQLRADSIVKNCEAVEKWVSAGLESVFVGFESVSQEGLDLFNKRSEAEYNAEAMAILNRLHLTTMGSFIVDPQFTKSQFKALSRFVEKTHVSLPSFPVLTPLPGTVLFEEREHELTTRNWELFDLQHAVLPTRTGLARFYWRWMLLWVSSYVKWLSVAHIARGVSQSSPRRFGQQVLRAVELGLRNNGFTLSRHHRLLPGALSRAPK